MLLALTGSEGKPLYDITGNFQRQTSSGVGKDYVADKIVGMKAGTVHFKLAKELRDQFYWTYQLDVDRMGDKTYEMGDIVQTAPHLEDHHLTHPHLNSLMCEYSKSQLQVDPFVWVEALISRIEKETKPDQVIVVSDCRQYHELLAFRLAFDAIIVDVVRTSGEGLRAAQPLDGELIGLSDYTVNNKFDQPFLDQEINRLVAKLRQRSKRQNYNRTIGIQQYRRFRRLYNIQLTPTTE